MNCQIDLAKTALKLVSMRNFPRNVIVVQNNDCQKMKRYIM